MSAYVISMMSITGPEYQEAMKFRHASSTMNMLLVQEGGLNIRNPDPKL